MMKSRNSKPGYGKQLKVMGLCIALMLTTASFTFAAPKSGETYVDEMTVVDYKAGETIKIGELVFTVDDVKTSEENTSKKAPEGYQYLYITLTAKNNGNTQVGMTSNMVFQLNGEDNIRYNLSMPEEPGSFNGLIDPGKSMSGHLCYLIPTQEQDYELVIKPSVNEPEYAVVLMGQDQWDLWRPVAISSETTSKQETKAEKNLNVKADEPFEIGDLVFNITKIYSNNGDTNNKPSPGNDYLYFDMTIENKGDHQVGMTAMTAFSLIDSEGNTYNIVLPEDEESLNGLIDPSENISGHVRFEVPKNEDDFQLKVKAFVMEPEVGVVEVNR